MKSIAKFFRGRSAISEIVELQVENGHLLIRKDAEIVARWPVSLIYRDPSHSVAVVLGCSGDSERLELLDKNILSQLPIDGHVWNREGIRQRSRQLWVWAAVSVIVVGGFVALTPRIAARLALQVPMKYEKALGDLVLRGANLKTCDLNTEQRRIADELLKKLSGEDIAQLHFVDSEIVNAYTFPGGGIYVFKGLVEKSGSSDELAGVLAHEIEHVKKRHVMQAVVRGMMFTGLLNFVLGDFSAILLIDPATAAQLLSLKLSRSMEQEADNGALKRLQAAQISPQGMADFFTKLQKMDVPSSLSFLSTHPSGDERSKMFNRAKKKAGETSPALAAEEWAQIRKICAG